MGAVCNEKKVDELNKTPGNKIEVVVAPDPKDGGFTVSCPAISGCHYEGETLEEALENIKDAISGCVEVLNERALRQQGCNVIDISV